MTGIRCTAGVGRNPKASKGEASNQDDIILNKGCYLGRAIRPKERAGYRAMGGAR